MSVISKLNTRPVANKVLGIDASSKRIAYTCYDGEKALFRGAIDLKGKDAIARAGDATRKLRAYAKLLDVDFVAIESAVYVNNKSTVIKLAYVYGAVIGEFGSRDIPVDVVAPISWMSHIGNPMWTKKERDAVYKKHTKKSAAKAELRDMRKKRTQDILDERFGFNSTDDDLCDSFGVAIFGYDKLTRRAE